MTQEKTAESISESKEHSSKESKSREPSSKESKSKEFKITTKAEPIKVNEPTAAELKDLLQRTQANLENYRKQMEKRVAEIREMAAREIILQLLPVIDNFELAFQNNQKQDQNFKEGIELIYGQLNLVLAQHQVQPLETKNQRFDPYYHKALIKVESEQPEGTILEEFQKGFLLHGEVIRHAKVKISSGKSTKQTGEQKAETPDTGKIIKDETEHSTEHRTKHSTDKIAENAAMKSTAK